MLGNLYRQCVRNCKNFKRRLRATVDANADISNKYLVGVTLSTLQGMISMNDRDLSRRGALPLQTPVLSVYTHQEIKEIMRDNGLIVSRARALSSGTSKPSSREDRPSELAPGE